jgi:hypothetical protein
MLGSFFQLSVVFPHWLQHPSCGTWFGMFHKVQPYNQRCTLALFPSCSQCKACNLVIGHVSVAALQVLQVCNTDMAEAQPGPAPFTPYRLPML